MDLNIAVPLVDDTRCKNSRYLPTYDAANTQYTLRLPSYRSSYIHRFHPYARITRFIEEQDVDNSNNEQPGEGTPLDLRVLGGPVEVLLPTASEGNLNKVLAEESRVSEAPAVIGSVIGNASL
ncbi:hypothetical protein F5887DRAFT_1069444 [Amanita rubescens]|nr:hypothetical protein F5887DRAFT_1069444 [Amanita rubescens]